MVREKSENLGKVEDKQGILTVSPNVGVYHSSAAT